MATITIRKLDNATVEALKARAKAYGRSMEEEARTILTQEARPGRLYGQAAVEHFKKFRQELFGDRVLPSSLEILREIREEDPTRSEES